MELPKGRVELRDGHFGVDLGAVDGAVTEDFLDVADGSAASDKMGRARVA